MDMSGDSWKEVEGQSELLVGKTPRVDPRVNRQQGQDGGLEAGTSLRPRPVLGTPDPGPGRI